MILSDNETKVDLLNNEAIAKTIVSLLRIVKNNRFLSVFMGTGVLVNPAFLKW